ncbi:SWIM zinc finger family protein [Brachybacterium sp. DNPG3]
MSIVLRSRRGAIGKSWHAVALREAIEGILGVGRAGGGKAAARAGRVQWIDIAPGLVRGDVLDDDGNVYQARLDLPALVGGDRAAVLEVARAHPELPALLAAGEYPQGIEGELAQSEVSLLPRGPSELTHDCSCLDWPGPCKHVAALSYVLVEAVDEQPLELITLRGLTLEDLVAPPAASARSAASSPRDPSDASDPSAPSAPAAPSDGSAPDGAGPAPAPALGGGFDARRADPAPLVEVLGEEVAAIISAFYRAGSAPSDDLQ